MTLIEAPRHATRRDVSDAEALIKEARQRQRKRRLLVGIVVLMAIIVSGITYAVVSRPSARSRSTRTSSPNKTVSVAQPGAFVSPRAPYALAIAPNGDLLVVDSGRNRVLRYLPSGKFQVLAGDGKRGFSGDGRQAVRAEINVDNWAGIAVAKNGIVYFADDGNDRVREILPNGIIETVAGGGTRALGQGSIAALDASLNGVAGLTIGPNGELYIAANGVYRLGPGGTLHWVVGKSVVPLPKNYCWDCNPAIQQDFTGVTRLAFDGNGDLLVAGGGGSVGVYEMAKSGRLRFVGVFRGDAGGPPALAAGTGGSVVLAHNDGIFRISPSGRITPIASPIVREPAVKPPALDKALGKMGGGPAYNTFIGGDGLAVGETGVIYVDTNAGNAWTTVSAILELRPNGSVVALWKS
jgi:serine/threonine-protein kinase